MSRHVIEHVDDPLAILELMRRAIVSASDPRLFLERPTSREFSSGGWSGTSSRVLACVIDLNPAKQGGFLPGTGHPILSPQAAEEQGIAAAILLNPNYEQEIRDMLASAQSSVKLVWADEVGAVH